MSADMFAPQKPATTKIPVPSPTPLRRSASLRIRGEAAAAPASRSTNQGRQQHPGAAAAALMEAQARSSRLAAEARTPGASPRVPQSPARNRSLVSRGAGIDRRGSVELAVVEGGRGIRLDM